MWTCNLFIAFSLTSTFLTKLTEGQATSVECKKDKDGPNIPVNIYYCTDPKKPECCEEDEEFTCCETQASKNRREQLMLWLPLSIIFVGVAVICICYRKDTHICEGASLKQRCCSCIGKKKQEVEAMELEDKDFNNLHEDGDDQSRSSTPSSRPTSAISVKSRQSIHSNMSGQQTPSSSDADSQRPLSTRK